MKLTKTYEINDDGDCNKCECNLLINKYHLFCIPFSANIEFKIQCQECKDYLAKPKAIPENYQCHKCEHHLKVKGVSICQILADDKNYLCCKYFKEIK